MIIYKITNLINNKIYIGQTTRSLELRWKQHCQLMRKRSCRLLVFAIGKYGKESFKVEIIEIVQHKDQLNEREKYWISFYSSFGPKGYNLTSGGDHIELHPESIDRIKKALTGRPTGRKGILTDHTPWNKGKTWSEEIKRKMSESHKNQIPWCQGQKLSFEHRQKLSESHKGLENANQSII